MAVTLDLPRWIPPAPATERRELVTPSRAPLTEHGARLGALIAVACMAIFLDGATSYESATALPYISGSFAATPDEASWLITLFNAAYETSILLSPWLLARFGRRYAFLGALCGFGACSIGCALAPDFTVFAVLRLVQGLTLGAFFACGVIVLFMSVPEKLRLLGIMLFSMASQAGAALAPEISGALVYDDAWRAIFALSAIVAFALALVIWRVLREPHGPQDVRFDIVSTIAIAGTMLALQYVVNEGERRNWGDDPWVIVALALVPVGAAIVVVWKLVYSRRPYLDFSVLRLRNLAVGAAIGFGLAMVLQGATQVDGFVRAALDFTPILAGDIDLLRALAIVIVVPVVTVAIARGLLELRIALVLGFALAFVGLRWELVATTTASDYGTFVGPVVLIGCGIAILYRALATVIFGSLPPRDLIMGLVVYKMSGVLGAAAATPLFATLLDHKAALHRSELAGGIVLASPAVRSFVTGAHHAMASLAEQLSLQSLALAYADACGVTALIVAGLVPLVLLIDVKTPPPSPAPSSD